MQQPLSTKRSTPKVSIGKGTGRSQADAEIKRVASRSPGFVYTLPSTLKTSGGPGFGVGKRFQRVRASHEDSPGPGSVNLPSTLGKHARSTKMRGRKAWRVRANVEARTNGPGPAPTSYTVPGTVGTMARAFSMHSRDAWLEPAARKESPTSDLGALHSTWGSMRAQRHQNSPGLGRAGSASFSPVRRH